MADRELIAAILTAGMLPTMEIPQSRAQGKGRLLTAHLYPWLEQGLRPPPAGPPPHLLPIWPRPAPPASPRRAGATTTEPMRAAEAGSFAAR